MDTRKRKAPSTPVSKKKKGKVKEASALDELCDAAVQSPEPLKSSRMPTPLEISTALRLGLEEDLKQEDEDAHREGRQPRIQFVELPTELGSVVRLQKIPRAHRLPQKEQLDRVMSVITTLVSHRVTPTTKHIKLMGIGAG